MNFQDLTALLKTALLLIAQLAVTTHGISNATFSRCYDNEALKPICFSTYIDRSVSLNSWSKAVELCNKSFSGILPVISSTRDQLRLEEFLWDSGLWIDFIWLGAQGAAYDGKWRWVDDTQIDGSALANPSGSYVSSAAVVTVNSQDDGILEGLDVGSARDGYICQVKGDCTGSSTNQYSLGGSCFKLHDDLGGWYTARNKCLYGKGDLAIIADTSTAGINNILNGLGYSGNKTDGTMKKYWIGGRRIWWKWFPSNKEYKMTYFYDKANVEDSNNAEGNCIAVDYKQQWAWSIRSCDILFHTVCQTGTVVSNDSDQSDPSKDVSLPKWAVGVICACVGFFYILSLIVIAIIVCKCCRYEEKDNEDEESCCNSARCAYRQNSKDTQEQDDNLNHEIPPDADIEDDNPYESPVN